METIKSNTEISLAFTHGRRLNGSCISLLIVETPLEHGPSGRVAFIAGKKLGGAVWRNAAKRRMRALARELGAPWAGYDVVFVAKKATMEQMYSKVLRQAQGLIQGYFEGNN